LRHREIAVIRQSGTEGLRPVISYMQF